MEKARYRKLSWHLAVLAISLSMPPIALAGLATGYFAISERSRLESIVDRTNADVARVIEAVLAGDVSMLQALATSPHLTTGDLQAFEAQARKLADKQSVTIVLTNLSHQQLINTYASPGQELPKTNDVGDVDFNSNGMGAYASNLFEGALSGRKITRIVVPVPPDGPAVYHLSATVDPKALSTTLRESLAKGPYFGTILDRNGVIIARSTKEEEFIGRPLKGLAESAARGASGIWEGVNPQGIPIFVHWRRSALSGWIVATGISQGALAAPLVQSLALLAAVSLALMLIALALAFRIVGKVTEATDVLVRLTEDLDAGRILAAPVTPLAEADLIAHGIARASERLNDQREIISQSHNELERRIEERTKELTLKRALLTSTLENMDQGLVALSDATDVRVYNHNAVRMLLGEGEHQEDVPGALARKIALICDDRVGGRMSAPDGCSKHRIFEHDTQDGSHLELRAVCMDGGKVYTISDVTDATRQARELQCAKDRAERESIAKSELLATMSHEIRTPLNSVLGSADMLALSVGPDSPHLRLVSRIITAGTALSTMMEDVLDLSKVETGRFAIRPHAFDLRELMDEIRALTAPAFETKEFGLDVEVQANLPTRFDGDDARLRQVLLNYVNNAVKFTMSGSVRLVVEGGRLEGGDWGLRFYVHDTGIGISKDKQSVLFQRYSQADASIQRRFGGTGLGLAICKKIVEAMGGEVGVESEPGFGTTVWFSVSLPEAHADEPIPDPAASRSVLHAVARRASVLVVEDIPVNQEVAKELLESIGHDVTVVASGAEAVAAVRNERFDVVLMDIFMSGMDGLEATRAIRRLDYPSCAVPVIACTANVLPPQIAEFRQAGLDCFIGKPLRRSELRTVISRFLHERGAVEPKRPQSTTLENEVGGRLLRLLGVERTQAMIVQFEKDLVALSKPMKRGPREIGTRGRLAHGMIGAAGLLGMERFAETCRRIDASCRNNIKPKETLARAQEEIGDALSLARSFAQTLRDAGGTLTA